MTNNELLSFALENDMIDWNTIEIQLQMNERKKYLGAHNYKIWQGENGKWYTYLPKETSGRKLIKKATKKSIEDAIISYYKAEERQIYIKDVFYEWINDKLRFNEIGQSTYDRYECEFKRLLKDSNLSKIKFRYIDEDLLELFIRETIADKKLTNKAYSNLRTLILGIFKYGKKKGYTKLSITTFMGDLDLSKRVFERSVKTKESQVFAEDEIPIITKWLRDNPTIKNLGILLLFQTGLRVGELVGLKFSDVNKRMIHVQRMEVRYKQNGQYVHEIVEYTKTNAGNRYLIITDSAIETIKQIKQLNPNSEYLFSINGKHIWKNTFNDVIYNACKKCNLLKRSTHKIRKTYGTKLLDNNTDESLVMSQMGHADINVTRKYYYYGNKNEQSNREQIEKAINM